MKVTKNIPLKDDKNKLQAPKKVGEIVKGKVIGIGSFGIFIDMCPFGSGIIYKKEQLKMDITVPEGENNFKKFKPGDEVLVKIVGQENEEGYFELSLTEAQKQLAWQKLEEGKKEDKTFKIKISKVNRGGLMAELFGIPGFLPLSQLSPEHYPHAEGDTAKILQDLQKFIGEVLEIKIFDFDPRQKKLIFSEKAKEIKNLEEALGKCKVNDVIKGTITGITDFGIFVKFHSLSNTILSKDSQEKISDNSSVCQLEGLIHISEIDLPHKKQGADKQSVILESFKVGQEIKAKIIKIVQGRIYLSLKNL